MARAMVQLPLLNLKNKTNPFRKLSFNTPCKKQTLKKEKIISYMKETINTAILVIDDEEMVRDNIEDILLPKKYHVDNDSMDEASSLLFETIKPLLAPRSSNIPDFTVAKAANGPEGLSLVRKAIDAGRPYAVIFLDMRMPGWDGLETALRIREYESKAEIIFVTAFSDRSIEEIVEKAGQNVSYHCKPYASEEIVQMASKAVSDYNKLRNLEKLIEAISSISLNEHQLLTLLHNILDQLAGNLQSDMALLGKLNEDFTYEKIFSIGTLEESINLGALIEKVKATNLANEQVVQIDEVVMVKMDHYTIFVALKKHESLKTEKMYLLKLFVQNAAKAIRNAELSEKLIQKEKLSAVGNAVGMVMHDLRSPIKSISMLTDILREDGINNQWVDSIDECARQASEVFDDFLDFIKETPVKKLPLNLDKVVTEGIKMAETKNSLGNVNLSKTVPADIVVQGDESKLKRTIMNIVNNAVEALKDNKVPKPVVTVEAHLNEAANRVILCISDNGPGIPPVIMKTLFEPFVTNKKANGTGLGLAIVKQYIVAHGGTINVENRDGAVFTISLPVFK